jgi:hypothetical protein
MSHISSAHSIRHTHYLLFKAAEVALVKADQDDGLRALHIATAYVMSAFALEAYVNDICAVSIPYKTWNPVERKLSTIEKVKLLKAHTMLKADFSKEPFQLLKQLFRTRDELAHSKRQVLEVEPQNLNTQSLTMPCSNLDKCLDDILLARKLHTAVFDIATTLHNARTDRDNDEHPFQAGAFSNFITITLTKIDEA